jgi:hypothetical protein
MGSDIEKPRRGWLRRHWKLVLSVWLGLAFVGGAGALIMMRSSDATKLSIAMAESNPILAQQIGQPQKVGWFISGSIEVQPESGHAELEIPVSGPKGSGTIYSEARKQAGLWHVQLLQFCRDGSADRLDLLTSLATTPAASSK